MSLPRVSSRWTFYDRQSISRRLACLPIREPPMDENVVNNVMRALESVGENKNSWTWLLWKWQRERERERERGDERWETRLMASRSYETSCQAKSCMKPPVLVKYFPSVLGEIVSFGASWDFLPGCCRAVVGFFETFFYSFNFVSEFLYTTGVHYSTIFHFVDPLTINH